MEPRDLLHCRQTLYHLSRRGSPWKVYPSNYFHGLGLDKIIKTLLLLLLLSRFSCVRLLVTPWAAGHQTPPFMGFSRQEHWSGLPLPSPKTLLASVFFSFFRRMCSGTLYVTKNYFFEKRNKIANVSKPSKETKFFL